MTLLSLRFTPFPVLLLLAACACSGSDGSNDGASAGAAETPVSGAGATGVVTTGTGASSGGGQIGGETGAEVISTAGQAGVPAAGGAAAGGTGGSGPAMNTGGQTNAGGTNAGGSPGLGPDADCLEMVAAAETFLESLGEALKSEAMFAWESSERSGFEFLPPRNAARLGLTSKKLDANQTAALDAFLKKVLSTTGQAKVEAIRQLELTLRTGAPGDDEYRDPENYFVSIFGEPNSDAVPWGWRFEGHHLSLHSSMVACREYSATPAFWGASGYENGQSPLASEADLAQTLFDSLGDLKATAGDGDKGDEAIEAKQTGAAPYPASGLSVSELSDAQKTTLRQLIQTYTSNMAAPIASQRLRAIEDAGLDQIRFYYSGDGYYRIQGPTFIIEHAPAGANHVHAVWRDFDGDWGEDLLKRHLAEMHSGSP